MGDALLPLRSPSLLAAESLVVRTSRAQEDVVEKNLKTWKKTKAKTFEKDLVARKREMQQEVHRLAVRTKDRCCSR